MSLAAPPAPVDKSERRIQTMFGEIAGRYDLMNHVLSGGVDYYWRWLTIRRCPIRGSSPVLDVCTGTGDLAIAYWKHGKSAVPVIGADFTHEMLQRATAKAGRASTSRQAAPLAFVEADAQHLPFSDNVFQIVSVAFGLRNVTDTRQGLCEMVRVCEPGGRIAVLEFSMPERRWFRSVYRWYFRNILPRIGQFVARNRQAAYEYLPQSVGEFPYGSELAAIMESCGMENVTFTPLTFGIATLYIGHKPAGSGHGG